jgi:RimJ/RimL family protein N-acetyltransferase
LTEAVVDRASEARAAIAETPRLRIRWLDAHDADFIVALVNDPAWIRYIGNKGVADRDDALRYLERGALRMYETSGFGLNLVQLKATGEPIGICGLIRRDGWPDVDLGFAFLPAFRRQGYAFEAATAVLSHGAKVLGIARVVAIVSPDNAPSIRLLERLGFAYERAVQVAPNAEEVALYAMDNR